jgi:hypothetical protein
MKRMLHLKFNVGEEKCPAFSKSSPQKIEKLPVLIEQLYILKIHE